MCHVHPRVTEFNCCSREKQNDRGRVRTGGLSPKYIFRLGVRLLKMMGEVETCVCAHERGIFCWLSVVLKPLNYSS